MKKQFAYFADPTSFLQVGQNMYDLADPNTYANAAKGVVNNGRTLVSHVKDGLDYLDPRNNWNDIVQGIDSVKDTVLNTGSMIKDGFNNAKEVYNDTILDKFGTPSYGKEVPQNISIPQKLGSNPLLENIGNYLPKNNQPLNSLVAPGYEGISGSDLHLANQIEQKDKQLGIGRTARVITGGILGGNLLLNRNKLNKQKQALVEATSRISELEANQKPSWLNKKNIALAGSGALAGELALGSALAGGALASANNDKTEYSNNFKYMVDFGYIE